MSFGLPSPVVDKLKTVFRDDPRILKVWLYGSRALGRERPGSDVDLCIEGKSLQLDDLLDIEMRIDELDLPWKIDLALMHNINNPALIEHIRRVGIVLLDRGQETKLARNFA